MELSANEYQHLVQEIACETGAKRDGTGKNLIVPRCPFCGKSGGKFGIYIGQATSRREPFMAHCFSCGKSTRTLDHSPSTSMFLWPTLQIPIRIEMSEEEIFDIFDRSLQSPLNFKLRKVREL